MNNDSWIFSQHYRPRNASKKNGWEQGVKQKVFQEGAMFWRRYGHDRVMNPGEGREQGEDRKLDVKVMFCFCARC